MAGGKLIAQFSYYEALNNIEILNPDGTTPYSVTSPVSYEWI